MSRSAPPHAARLLALAALLGPVGACSSARLPNAPEAGASDDAAVGDLGQSPDLAAPDLLAPPLRIEVASAQATPLAPRFLGNNAEHPFVTNEFTDPAYLAALAPLGAGWIRFPGGIESDAYDWVSGEFPRARVDAFAASPVHGLLQVAQLVTFGKGGVPWRGFAGFARALGARAVICLNVFTDTAASLGSFAQALSVAGADVAAFELGNEPYLFAGQTPGFVDGTDFAARMAPVAQAVHAAYPGARVSIPFAGRFPGAGADPGWDAALARYPAPYWDTATIHVYPLPQAPADFGLAMAQLAWVLLHGSTELIDQQLVPRLPPGGKVLVSEFNATPTLSMGDVPLLQSIYNGLFLAEYAVRLSADRDVVLAGPHTMYLPDSGSSTVAAALVRSARSDYAAVQAAALAGHAIDTTGYDYGYYYSAPGLALSLASGAVNGSDATLATAVHGGPSIVAAPLDATSTDGGEPMPAVYAQAYRGAARWFVLAINKAPVALPLTLTFDGQPAPADARVESAGAADPQAANSATQASVAIVSGGGGALVLGPHSLTRISWPR